MTTARTTTGSTTTKIGRHHPDEVSCEFRVIGERRDDPGRLLLLGSDGRWYAYDITGDDIAEVGPSETWTVDAADAPGAGPEGAPLANALDRG